MPANQPTASEPSLHHPAARRTLDALGVAEALSQLEVALAKQDPDAALPALEAVHGHAHLPAGSLDGAHRQVARWFLQHRRCDAAHRAARLVQQPTEPDHHFTTYAGNLAAVAQHRPALLDRLLCEAPPAADLAHEAKLRAQGRLSTLAPDAPYRLVRDEVGQIRSAQQHAPGNFQLVPPANRFADFAKHSQADLEQHGHPAIALLSVGDGQALPWLAQLRPALFMDQTLAVHLIEPDLDRLRLALHLHDLTGDDGPIASPRFLWHIGDDWPEQFLNSAATQPWTPLPARAICPDAALAATLGPALREVSAKAHAQWAARRDTILNNYAHRDDNEWIALFSPQPPRQPRIAVLTSRFTTVLQYAARDSAAALRRLGWDAQVFMESHPHERFHEHAITAALETFQPDAIFTIDTPRKFIENVVPPRVPVLYWIQDALPRLMNDTVGQSTTTRDFVLTFFASRLIREHAYPARQCVDMPMMVTSPRLGDTPDTADALAQAWSRRTGPDFLYASNVSATPEALFEHTCGKAQGTARTALQASAYAILKLYDAGRNLPTEPDLDTLLTQLVAEGSLPDHPPTTRRQLRDALWNPLNTGLYRQQALRWVAELADAQGATLRVHGRGWEAHPQFARFAHGPLDHAALQRATADARFVLHLEPYICFTHHRMLDALQAGTPVLVRQHPGDFGLQRVARFLAEHAPAAQTDDDAHAMLPDPALRRTYDALTHELRGVTLDLAGDVAAQVRGWQRAGVLPDDTGEQPAMPALDAVGFVDAPSLATRWTALRNDPPAIGAMLLTQRATVARGLTFDAALRRVLGRVYALLREEPTVTRPA